MEVKEKINLIDTAENKQVIAVAIAKDILTKYGLTEFPDMEQWLIEEMTKHSLFELVFANNGFITLLAERCAHDIGVFMVVGLIEEDEVHETLIPIYAFIDKVCKEFNISHGQLFIRGTEKFAKAKGETIIVNEDVAVELMAPVLMGRAKSEKVPSIVAWAMAEAGVNHRDFAKPTKQGQGKPRHKRAN